MLEQRYRNVTIMIIMIITNCVLSMLYIGKVQLVSSTIRLFIDVSICIARKIIESIVTTASNTKCKHHQQILQHSSYILANIYFQNNLPVQIHICLT